MTLGDLPPTFVPGFHKPEDLAKMKYNRLGETDMMVSKLGLGASSFGAVFQDRMGEELCSRIVEKAICSGINYIDTAPWYGEGKSEAILGKALKNIPRQSYYIATKIGRYQTEVDKMFNFTSEKTIQSVEESLRLLGLKYIDVVQLHDVEFCASNQQLVKHTIPALVELKKTGKIKHIGVTAYPLDILKDLVKQVESGTISTVLSYCRATLFDQELLEEKNFFQEHGVGVINASPLAMGLMSNRGPPAWHPANQKLRDACHQAALHCHQKDTDISNLALQFALREPGIATTLVSPASLEFLDKNLNALANPLSPDDEKVLAEIREKFFKPLKSADRNWQKIEVVRYWTSMKVRGLEQPMEN